MKEKIYNKRPAYLNNEIVKLFNDKIKENNEDIQTIAKRYNVNECIIKYMLDRKCRYSYKMLNIASDYLNIPYDELTSILIDDEYKLSKEHKELNKIITYIFDEMIKHKRLSSK